MQRFICSLLLVPFLILPVAEPVRSVADVPVPEPAAVAPQAEEVAADPFVKEFRKAVQAARKSGKIGVVEALKLRVASFSPAFMEKAKTLCVTQIAFSGEQSDAVPYTETGAIDVDGINWEAIADFLERIIPLILQMLLQFGL